MPSAIREHQHELCDVDGENGIVFGTEDTGYLTLARPTISGGDLRSGDSDRSQEDGITMGRDYLGAKTYTFEVGVLTDQINGLGYTGGLFDPHRANLDALDRLEAEWTSKRWRKDPWTVAMLRTCSAGRITRCYGRPRRWDEAAGNLTSKGYTPVVSDFQLIDNRWYSDEEYVMEVGLIAPPEGGFVAPLVAPITTTKTTSSDAILTVGGNTETWPIIEFYGPVSQPRLRIGDLIVGLDGILAYDQTAVVDARPWVRTVTREPDDAGIAGWLNAETPALRDLLLEPGAHDVTYSGRDITGTSYARVKWRTARTRP